MVLDTKKRNIDAGKKVTTFIWETEVRSRDKKGKNTRDKELTQGLLVFLLWEEGKGGLSGENHLLLLLLLLLLLFVSLQVIFIYLFYLLSFLGEVCLIIFRVFFCMIERGREGGNEG